MKLLLAFKYALTGLKEAFLTEYSFRLELIFGIPLAIIFSWYFWPLTPLEILLVIISCLLVLVAELFNTSIENIWDFINPEKNEIVGRSKDIAGAAVFISILIALSVAAFITSSHLN